MECVVVNSFAMGNDEDLKRKQGKNLSAVLGDARLAHGIDFLVEHGAYC